MVNNSTNKIHRIITKSNKTGATHWSGTVYPYGDGRFNTATYFNLPQAISYIRDLLLCHALCDSFIIIDVVSEAKWRRHNYHVLVN
jgi:hypothetical protein